MTFSANLTGVTLPALGSDVRSVDIFFGEERVWSIDLSEGRRPRGDEHEWPQPLLPYLVGSTRVRLAKSGSELELGAVDVSFTDDQVHTRVTDADGIPLALNKWGRLGKTLEAGNVGVQERILDRTAEVIANLAHMGLRPFVVGGTLLGGVRDGALLPHDDDADVAYLSTHTNPVDVAAEGFAIGHRLEALGYELVRHSATHMQLYFRGPEGQLDHYVDVFAAFFTDDGCINQPFHVRGKMREDQMLPFGTTTIQGREYPAPADPEAWLVLNYDENWRTPIPGYRLHTPRPTIRRFQNWFGSFHYTRDFWNEHYQTGGLEADERWQAGRAWLLEQHDKLRSRWVIDLGAGAGALSADLYGEDTNRTVIAADYSPAALELVAGRGAAGVEPTHVNLYRNRSLTLPRTVGITGAFDLVANHLIESLGPHGMPQAFRFVRMALRSGGVALATLYGARDLSGPQHEPTSWAIEPGWLRDRAAEFGLRAEIVALQAQGTELARAPYGVRFSYDKSLKKESS